jgi:hypothetical protein
MTLARGLVAGANVALQVRAAVIVVDPSLGLQSPVNCTNSKPVAVSTVNVTASPSGSVAAQVDPSTPHTRPPDPTMVPPVGFRMVSCHVTAGVLSVLPTGSNAAPQFRG